MSKKRIFVTGITGFIAGHVVEELLERGYDVLGNMRSMKTENGSNYLSDPRVQLYIADGRDEALMRMIVEKCDGVINLQGILGTTIKSIADMKIFEENNVGSAHNIIRACLTLNTPMVQIGVGNYKETNYYSNTKTKIEKDVIAAAKYLGLKANVVRGLNAYGPRQKVHGTGKIIPTFITKALLDEDISVYGGKDNCGIMDMIYVKDLAKILVNVLEDTMKGNDNGYSNPENNSPYGHVIEAGTGVGLSVFEIAQKIKDITESNSNLVEVEMRPGESLRSVVVAEKAYPMEFTPLDEALSQTMMFYLPVQLRDVPVETQGLANKDSE